MADAIIIRNLTHAYANGIPVLRGVDLTVQSGEMVGLIGLSGSGKSTLLRCVNGLVSPTGGSAVVLGSEIESMPEGGRRLLRRRIGMIFQEFNLIDRLSVLKNVLTGRLGYVGTVSSCLHRFSASDLRICRDAVAQVGLAGYEKRRVRDLSGGQKQRVAIARAVAQGADLVLADEATANLDVLTKDDIMELIRSLVSERQIAVLASMHDVPLARRYCDRIVGLKAGRITFDAPSDRLDDAAVADVMNRPASKLYMGSGS